VVAEQVKRELVLSCHVAETNAAAKPILSQASLVVTSEAETVSACPVIAIKNPPIRLSQLLEEITAQLQKPASDTLALAGGYSLQMRQKQLVHDASGKAVDLTDKEAQLLQSLARARSKSAAKDQLLKEVWGIEAVLDTHTLETHIYRLRGKCKELAGDDLIEAVDGGYKLAPP